MRTKSTTKVVTATKGVDPAKTLKLVYTNSKNETKIRKVIPTGELKFSKKTGNWTMPAFDVSRKAMRSFNLNKIDAIKG